MKKENGHKATIETMINTAALALTSFAVITLTNNNSSINDWVKGLVLLLVGMALEFIKYMGRQKKLW